MATDITELYKDQISLTEWFARAGVGESEAHRKEDNEKRERLAVLHEYMQLPYDKQHRFSATDLVSRPNHFIEFVTAHGHELCALRLVPLDPSLPKLRMRGLTIEKALGWFAEQKIDPAQYYADFVPHAEKSDYASIFVVTDTGVFGEFTAGGHHQLTQGFFDVGAPVSFYYNFKEYVFSEAGTPELQAHIREVVEQLHVQDPKTQQQLQEVLGAEFVHGYLKGYFETVSSADFGLWFMDYNRLLAKGLEMPMPQDSLTNDVKESVLLQGMTGSPGIVRGRVKKVPIDQVSGATLLADEILVCNMTSPHYLPLMSQCAGIITDQGGILSHAAIVCRELGKPCVVGTKVATEVLDDGMEVLVDPDTGRVYTV